MPLFKFLRTETWKWNFLFDGPKRLKYTVHNFWPILTVRCYECNAMNVRDTSMNARRRRWFDWGKNKRIPDFIEERDLTLLGDNVGSVGNKGSSTITLIVVWRRNDKHYLLLMWDSLAKKNKGGCKLFAWHKKIKVVASYSFGTRKEMWLQAIRFYGFLVYGFLLP